MYRSIANRLLQSKSGARQTVARHKTRFSRRLDTAGDAVQRKDLELKELLRWRELAAALLLRLDLPAVKVARRSEDPKKTLMAAIGAVRYSTLRKRVRTVQKLHDWCFGGRMGTGQMSRVGWWTTFC